jgi:Uma2 family endonuclease
MKTQVEDTLTHARRDLKTMASFAAPTSPTESASANAANGHKIVYPESDGKPMADNTRQFRYIVMIQGGIAALFADRADVFVAGDLLWYPVEGDNRLRIAPDIMVVFGRPPGDRGAYLQWREDGIAPQVVFEVMSPGNTFGEMARKLRMYERYGVEEYYLYDTDRGELSGWLRHGDNLEEIDEMTGWISPRLKVRFDLDGADLALYGPDDRRFAFYGELEQRSRVAEARASFAAERADAAEARAETAEVRAEAAEARIARLVAQLRAQGIEPVNDGESL